MASTISQRLPSDRRFEFSSQACPADTFAVVRMSGFEAISRPYRFELVLVSDDARIDLARVLAAKAELRILAPDTHGKATPYAGVLAEFDQLHQAGGFTFYRAVLVPRLWQLSLYRNSEVYLHEQTIPDIVEGILKGGGLNPTNDYTLKLRARYRPRSYVCQYQETPLAFISRWLEREGIYYYFEQADGADRLVLLDDKVAQPAPAITVNYRPADELDVGLAADSVQGFVCRTRPLPKTLVLQDYNHRRASMPLVAQAEVSASGLGEEMLYGENFRTEEEGQRYATIRAEELRCGGRVFSGEATAVGLRSGHFMDLSHHYRDDFNGRYLVTEITHEGSQAGALLAGLKTPFNEREGQTVYRNSFVALPEATQFRPARTTPKPRVAGTMSATVDAEGSGDYAELDEHGQYKVQIPFDRTEKGAAKGSRPVRMASPYSGSDHGMHFPLHKGTEVLLSFVDGDPDQPVILGAVPNSDNPSVVDSGNPRLSLIKTKGGNEIGLDDTKGKESIWLQSPYQDSALIIGYPVAQPMAAIAAAQGSAAPPPPPSSPGNVYLATKGGSDSVTFGHSNSMSFGSKNSLSLGTEASVGASFANKVAVGASVAISLASDLKWSMNLSGSNDKIKLLTRSFAIDDTKSVSLKVEQKTTVKGLISFSAGADPTAITNMKLDSKQTRMRELISIFTALNFAQSAAFGLAVNGTAGGFATLNSSKDEKQDSEREAAKNKKANDELKKKEIEGIEKDWNTANATDAARIEKLSNEGKPTQEQKDELQRLNEKKEKGIFARKKEIDQRYSEIDAAGSSVLKTPGLLGWRGVLGKASTDAVINVGALGLFQLAMKDLLDDIDKLHTVSHMQLDSAGIVQEILKVDPNDATKTIAESKIHLAPVDGIDLEGTAIKLSANAGPVDIEAGTLGAVSASISLAGDVGKATEIKLDGPGNNVKLTAPQAALEVKGNQISLAAGTVLVGAETVVRNPAHIVLMEQLDAATKACAQSRAAWKAAAKKKDEEVDEALKLVATVTERTALAALDASLAVKYKLSKLYAASDPMASVNALKGLKVDSAATEMSFGVSTVKAAQSGVDIKYGPAKLVLDAQGLSADGLLIKLG